MTTALDTDALLALILDDAYTDESEKAIRQAYRDGLLAISPIVYAELAADGAFDSVAHLDQFLEDFSIQVDQPSWMQCFGLVRHSHGTSGSVRIEFNVPHVAPSRPSLARTVVKS